jgi:hypothetical protein
MPKPTGVFGDGWMLVSALLPVIGVGVMPVRLPKQRAKATDAFTSSVPRQLECLGAHTHWQTCRVRIGGFWTIAARLLPGGWLRSGLIAGGHQGPAKAATWERGCVGYGLRAQG